MPVSEARVETTRSSRYLTQLCQHFAHKVEAEWDESRGHANFGWGTATLTATPDALLIRAESPDEEGLRRVEHVVQDHTERFGGKDELCVAWSRSAA
jgi:hypothetical protein